MADTIQEARDHMHTGTVCPIAESTASGMPTEKRHQAAATATLSESDRRLLGIFLKSWVNCTDRDAHLSSFRAFGRRLRSESDRKNARVMELRGGH